MESVKRAQQWITDVGGEILNRTVERDQVDVADNRTGFGQGPTTDATCRPEYLDSPELTAHHRLLRPFTKPVTQCGGFVIHPDQFHQRGGIQVDHSRSSRSASSSS